jgi:hypothetical protein
MEQFLTSFTKALPVLLTIFFAVFFLILVTRIVFTFLLNQAYQRYLDIKNAGQKLLFSNKKKLKKADEELMRKKSEIPRAHSEVKAEIWAQENSNSSNYEIMSSQEREQDQEMNQVNIVDIVKPIGFWTSMILGQKLTYLIKSAQALNKRGDKGFWASMIEAKEREAGRQHSRGR